MSPHHWINADGTCHAGELFEHGTETTGVYLTEQVDQLMQRAMVLAEMVLADHRPYKGGGDFIGCHGKTCSPSSQRAAPWPCERAVAARAVLDGNS